MPAAETTCGEGPSVEAWRRLDSESREWLDGLCSAGSRRDDTLARLHRLLVRVARSEVGRRNSTLRLAGPELDDIAHQAAADALMAIDAKVHGFRGESRFTTWAYKFVSGEVSTKIGRHFWRRNGVSLDQEEWGRLPERVGLQPRARAEWNDLVAALRRAVDEDLTDHQRRLFVAIILNGVPVDALAMELDTSRNAIYKALFDGRRKLRANLAADGYISDTPSRAS